MVFWIVSVSFQASVHTTTVLVAPYCPRRVTHKTWMHQVSSKHERCVSPTGISYQVLSPALPRHSEIMSYFRTRTLLRSWLDPPIAPDFVCNPPARLRVCHQSCHHRDLVYALSPFVAGKPCLYSVFPQVDDTPVAKSRNCFREPLNWCRGTNCTSYCTAVRRFALECRQMWYDTRPLYSVYDVYQI